MEKMMHWDIRYCDLITTTLYIKMMGSICLFIPFNDCLYTYCIRIFIKINTLELFLEENQWNVFFRLFNPLHRTTYHWFNIFGNPIHHTALHQVKKSTSPQSWCGGKITYFRRLFSIHPSEMILVFLKWDNQENGINMEVKCFYLTSFNPNPSYIPYSWHVRIYQNIIYRNIHRYLIIYNHRTILHLNIKPRLLAFFLGVIQLWCINIAKL